MIRDIVKKRFFAVYDMPPEFMVFPLSAFFQLITGLVNLLSANVMMVRKRSAGENGKPGMRKYHDMGINKKKGYKKIVTL